ncbi:MAG: phosphomethylpyrimidine synthase, partial [Terrimicrobiaceae bacterium]
MIAPAESFEPSSTEPLPNSSRVYVEGTLHKNVRVPMREISLSPTKRLDGSLEKNEPVRVYDASGPWGDENFDGDVTQGLPALRAEWIKARADVSEYEGREVKPQDNGYLSRNHAEYASKAERNRLLEFPGLRRKPLRASAGHPVTQLWYARQGIVTPEMEFIAIRENMGRAKIAELGGDILRNDLEKQHAGSAQLRNNPYTPGIFGRFPQRIPAEITPEFVR